jgi:ADP-L-glycero-D-manno-heptose 6-epimerase
MNILLTGHRGFIGSHMLTALEANGHTVSTYEWGDILPSVMEQDWVIHMGAISSTTERDIEKVMQQNVDFTTQLYEACHTFGVNFQYSSSASVYGLISTFREDAEVDPRTPYAWSKYLTERYIRRHPMGARSQIFRYFNVYGPDGEAHKGNQASPYYQFTEQAKNTGVIRVFKDSDKYLRDFVHVSDVVATHLKFLNIKQSGLWNLGTGVAKSFQSVADEIAKQYNAKIEYIDMPEILKNSYQRYTKADLTNMQNTLLEYGDAV